MAFEILYGLVILFNILCISMLSFKKVAYFFIKTTHSRWRIFYYYSIFYSIFLGVLFFSPYFAPAIILFLVEHIVGFGERRNLNGIMGMKEERVFNLLIIIASFFVQI